MEPNVKALFQMRRVRRIRHEVRHRELEVVRVERVSRNFVAVAFAGESLADFVSESFDDHVKFMFTDETGELVRRDYTPRRFDPETRELTIEFGLHSEGRASGWVRQASSGQRAVIGGPRGSLIIPKDCDWHFLVGDATALPAIHRRLEELPATVRAIVMVQLADPSDRRDFKVAARVNVQWVSTSDELVSAVRAAQLPSGDGFTWCAGEAATMARLRQILLNEKALPQRAVRIGAYWKRGYSAFMKRSSTRRTNLPHESPDRQINKQRKPTNLTQRRSGLTTY
jgi:NADPH-dependent ferric siderophore reductase